MSKTIRENENIKKMGEKNASAIVNCGEISLIFEVD